MSFSIQNISIRYKITVLVMLACTITLAVGFTVALRNDVNLLRKDFKEITETKAKLIGEYAISSLSVHDKQGAKKTLETGVASIDYLSIELYDESGNLFTKLGKAEEKIPAHIRLTVDTTVFVVGKHEIKFNHVIKHEDHTFGYLILHASTQSLENEINKDIRVLILSAIGIILIGGILIFYAQKAISLPIFRLTKYLDYVAENSGISKTIPVRRRDEIGSIYQAINKLLKTIQENAAERNLFFGVIQKNNDKLGRTLDAFSDGHWEYNLKTDTWFFSDAWLNTFGYKRSTFDFSNQYWEKIIHPDDFDIYKEQLKKHLDFKEEYFDAEFRILGKKGGYRWVNFKGHWVEQENDQITDMLGITNDIQEQKDNLELINSSNQRKVNESKLQALRQMVSGISHSLKNLLSPIYGYADFGLMTIDDNSLLKKELEVIKHSAKKADEIVEDMLSFAVSGNLQKSSVNIIEILNGIIGDFEKFNSKNIVIKFETTLKNATLFGDGRKIKQAFTHIIQNAIDASFEDDLIEMKLEYLEINTLNKSEYLELPTGEYVSIYFQDHGQGIEEEHIDRIFEPFFSTKEIGEGVGLGLSVAKGIVAAHNGFVFVNSALYRGTNVHILLPTM
jgi:PAS domain S-box-containing protein